MIITIDTSQPISTTDADTLRLLLDGLSTPTVPSSNGDAPAGTSTPSKARARKKATETPVEPEPEQAEAQEPDENLDPELLEKAIAKATELLKNKESALVKQALTKAGVKRVSHLDSNEKIRIVLDHFEEADA